MLSFVKNGERDVWVGYNAETGVIVGKVQRHTYGDFGFLYSVWVPSPVAPSGFIIQGEWASLERAQADLQNWA